MTAQPALVFDPEIPGVAMGERQEGDHRAHEGGGHHLLSYLVLFLAPWRWVSGDIVGLPRHWWDLASSPRTQAVDCPSGEGQSWATWAKGIVPQDSGKGPRLSPGDQHSAFIQKPGSSSCPERVPSRGLFSPLSFPRAWILGSPGPPEPADLFSPLGNPSLTPSLRSLVSEKDLLERMSDPSQCRKGPSSQALRPRRGCTGSGGPQATLAARGL